ncbi:MAG: regulatory protein RecX [Bacillota bacterium]
MIDDTFKKKARSMVLRWLGYRQRSLRETRAYMEKKGFYGLIIDQVITELLEYGYLNDECFAADLIRSYLRRGFGPRRARLELLSKGIDGATIERLIAEHFDSAGDLARAGEILHKRANSSAVIDERWIRRQAAFLARRGFQDSIILKAIRDYSSAGSDET